MSRHELVAKQPGLVVAVGWDNPLQTFFAQVMRVEAEDGDEDEDPVILWLGTATREYPIPESLVAPLRPYADVGAELLSQLRADLAAASDKGPSPLQRLLRR